MIKALQFSHFVLTLAVPALILGTLNLLYPEPQSPTGQSAEASETFWFKGNTHTHSLWSDGNDFPEMIVDWYDQRDYDFLALSDHNVLSEGERWMREKDIQNRRQTLGPTTLEKYRERFGNDWVETREGEQGLEVRLKGLDEFRSKFEKPNEFLLIEAEEITDSFEDQQIHMNAVNLSKVIKPQHGTSVVDTMRRNLRAARAQEAETGRPILVHLNHPNFMWGVTFRDLAEAIEEDFFEVYNGHPSINHLGDAERPGDERIWDLANTARLTELHARPLFGIASDDSHHYHGGDVSPGRGWVMVKAENLEADTLIRAMRRGDFYASSGVTLTDVSFNRHLNELSLSIDEIKGETYTTKIIGTRQGSETIGEVLATVQGLEVRYKLKGDELYIRATVTSSASHPNPSHENQRKKAWTQPVGWRAH